MNKIKELRKQAGLSQTELADKIDTTYQQIQKLEQKSPEALNVGWVNKIAAALNCTPGEILGQPETVMPLRPESLLSDPAYKAAVKLVADIIRDGAYELAAEAIADIINTVYRLRDNPLPQRKLMAAGMIELSASGKISSAKEKT
jgi:transcriptional regulator with XRE-family HTH domain